LFPDTLEAWARHETHVELLRALPLDEHDQTVHVVALLRAAGRSYVLEEVRDLLNPFPGAIDLVRSPTRHDLFDLTKAFVAHHGYADVGGPWLDLLAQTCGGPWEPDEEAEITVWAENARVQMAWLESEGWEATDSPWLWLVEALGARPAPRESGDGR